ncbi:hypothetical protein Dsin_001425 [Dipteronia sinensis]|uniref:Uncharacterized protein n=1 Tax=Dipteronia sinensis TaxID=43782 RepID=A0AAE0B5C6_9ROSI|nr:hypothetical protein Dsin_001425 [Dipteronia sinensis]
MSFDEHPVKIENARLIKEIDRISAIAAKYVGNPMVNYQLISHLVPTRPLELCLVNFGGQQGI